MQHWLLKRVLGIGEESCLTQHWLLVRVLGIGEAAPRRTKVNKCSLEIERGQGKEII